MKNFIYVILVFFISCQKNDIVIPELFLIQATVSPNESGTVVFSKTGPYSLNENITVTAVANPNYIFSHWAGDLAGELVSLDVLTNKNFSLVAVFLPLKSFSNENVVLYQAQKIDHDGYFFMIENGKKDAYLVNHEGEKVFEWNFEASFGNDIELTASGDILACFKVADPTIIIGGFGGVIKRFNPQGELIWNYEVNSKNEIAHHDATELPNGHILIMLWERIEQSLLFEFGLSIDHDIFLEKLIEVDPSNNHIVWQWRSWDHIVQDIDEGKSNYGIISAHPNKINISYNKGMQHGDWMHANGIFYDSSKDLIYLSVNFYSEVWVIDHSTTLEEATSENGGAYNRGGDLVYRFGNPTTYNENSIDRFFFNNHHPSIVPNGYVGATNFLIYNNGSNNKQSIAYELILPTFSQSSMQNFVAPLVQWSFTDPSMYFDKISGVQRLLNGNTLICEGDYGFWEVTPSGEVVWKYDGLGTSFWRGYYYLKNDTRLLAYKIDE
tara:strand:+ start:689 stop:2176 length:1488 start_codon:yes stop_codon:yes gene_type:complete